jgi:hypothetical protein
MEVASLKAGVLSGDRGRSQAGRLLRTVLPRERWSFVMFQRRKTECSDITSRNAELTQSEGSDMVLDHIMRRNNNVKV